MTGSGTTLITVEDNVDAWKKMTTLLRPDILMMRSHTGYLTGMAANAAGSIGNNKSIHLRPFYYYENDKGHDAIIRRFLCSAA